jgi:hypothetical protein
MFVRPFLVLSASFVSFAMSSLISAGEKHARCSGSATCSSSKRCGSMIWRNEGRKERMIK